MSCVRVRGSTLEAAIVPPTAAERTSETSCSSGSAVRGFMEGEERDVAGN